MSRRPRRNHTPGFKAKVALASIKGDRTLAQLAEQFDVHPNQITSWKAQLEEGAADVFGSGGGNGGVQPAVDVKSLLARLPIWPLCSIGSAVACCRGAYRSRWRRRSASRRWRTLSLITASPTSSTPIKAVSLLARHSLAC